MDLATNRFLVEREDRDKAGLSWAEEGMRGEEEERVLFTEQLWRGEQQGIHYKVKGRLVILIG